jgi:hypothetical protein
MKRKKKDIRRRLLDQVKEEMILPPLPNQDVILDVEEIARHSVAFQKALANAQCIEASNVARYFEETYVGEDKAGRNFWGDLKCMIPPFESFFIEWEKPTGMPFALRMGVLFIACKPDEAEARLREIIGENAHTTPKKIAEFQAKNPKWIYLTFDVVEFPNKDKLHVSGLRSPYHLGCIAVSEEGAIVDFWYSHASGAISKRESEIIGAASMPAFTALTMLNCDNIDTVPHEAPEPFQRSRTRAGKLPLVSYRTIQVNLEKTPRSIGAERLPEVDEDGKVRLHQKRGHLKDYRKGKGLFGKYKGLWYWGPTLAGSGEVGVVVSDYEVKAP